MKITADTSGFKVLKKDLKKLENQGPSVKIEDLFSEKFMCKYTNFKTIEDLLSSCGIQTQSDFDKYPDGNLDKFIRSHTKFMSWKEMMDKARNEYQA